MALWEPTPHVACSLVGSPPRRSPRRIWGVFALIILLAALLVLSGCINILSVTTPTGVEAGTHYTMTVRVQPDADQTADGRMTLSVRIPNQWTVSSVTYAGAVSGSFSNSGNIANYFATEWEAKPIDERHNGPKAGYKWWSGYSENLTGLLATQWADITIVVNTNGFSGAFNLDFVTGLATLATPTVKADNGDGEYWEYGEALLNRAVTLLPTVKPFVVSTDPPAGSVNVVPSVSPTVTFNENMDPSSLGGNVFVRENGGATVASAVSYDPATKTYSLNPSADLDPSTAYEIVVQQAVEDAAGNTMAADYVVGFTTAAPAPVAPQVIDKTPAPGATGAAVGTDVTAVFDQDMDATTITDEYFYLTTPASPTKIPATVTYFGASKRAVIDPVSDLDPSTEYTVSLRAGVKGMNGLSVQGAPVTWSFTTAAAAALTFPDVPPSHDFYEAIQGMADLSIINGYTNGNFGPSDPVRRWQFAKMIVGALSLPIFESDTSPFTDLDPDDVLAIDMTEYVAVAFKNGITTGTTSSTYGPYSYISRTQVVTMVVRAVQSYSPGALATPTPGYTNAWGTGYSSIHGPLARIAEYNGLLAGIQLSGAANNPWSSMPRGEVAQILWNMMDLLNLR